MKTTGIIRRIDELGRIVIPKEIRKNMRIKNGDSLEIFVDDDSIMLKKYSPIESIEDSAKKIIESLRGVIKHNIIVTDKDKVISCSLDIKKNYYNKSISEFCDRCIDRRDNFSERQKKVFSFVDGVEELGYYSFSSIIFNGDTLGSVIIFSNDIPLFDYEEKLVVIISKMLSNNFLI